MAFWLLVESSWFTCYVGLLTDCWLYYCVVLLNFWLLNDVAGAIVKKKNLCSLLCENSDAACWGDIRIDSAGCWGRGTIGPVKDGRYYVCGTQAG